MNRRSQAPRRLATATLMALAALLVSAAALLGIESSPQPAPPDVDRQGMPPHAGARGVEVGVLYGTWEATYTRPDGSVQNRRLVFDTYVGDYEILTEDGIQIVEDRAYEFDLFLDGTMGVEDGFWWQAPVSWDAIGDCFNVTRMDEYEVEVTEAIDHGGVLTATHASGTIREVLSISSMRAGAVCDFGFEWTVPVVLVRIELPPLPETPTPTPVPAETPTATEAQRASPEPTDAPAPALPGPSAQPTIAGPPPGAARPAAFVDAIPAPAAVSTDPIVLGQSALLALMVVLLMPFPAQLFNSTLETHEDEVRRWLRLDRLGALAAGAGRFWASWPGVATFTVLAAALYGFLDPGFGLSMESLATFLGLLVGIVLVVGLFSIPAVLAHRRIGDVWQLKVVPISILIGLVCVLISRISGFQPGYLYGLLIGVVFARELSKTDEGRATFIGAALMLGAALIAWLGLGLLPAGDGFALVVARTVLAATLVAGLEGVVFGLLPLRFLPGEPLFAWNRRLWAIAIGIGAFAFFHILINPASGYLSDSSRVPLLTTLVLLIGFSAVSVVFWAWFRFRGSTDVVPAD